MKVVGRVIFLVTASVVVIGCSGTEDRTGCNPPPSPFLEADLAGTWIAELPGRIDTLLIRENGQFRQTIHIESPSFDYEGQWEPWWIEYQENGIPHLHLEGMRLCVYFGEIDCEQVGGGEHYWRDFCQDKWVQTPNDGVLMVLGTPEQLTQPSRGFELVALAKHLEGVTFYELHEP